MGRLIVTAAVAVLPTTDGREQYLYKGAIVDSDAFTEKGLEHARVQGLIDDAPDAEEEPEPETVFLQADVDAAVKTATEAKDKELKSAQAEVKKLQAELAKSAAGKQSAAAADKPQS
jgi:hypothetical protein